MLKSNDKRCMQLFWLKADTHDRLHDFTTNEEGFQIVLVQSIVT